MTPTCQPFASLNQYFGFTNAYLVGQNQGYAYIVNVTIQKHLRENTKRQHSKSFAFFFNIYEKLDEKNETATRVNYGRLQQRLKRKMFLPGKPKLACKGMVLIFERPGAF